MSGRAPAFQFYAADWLSDENVTVMSLEEEGAYIRAIALCWREGSIPADEAKLSRLLKGASNTCLTAVRSCFIINPEDCTRLFNPRLEREREKQAVWRESKSKAGRMSGKSRRKKKLQEEQETNTCSVSVRTKTNSSSSSSSSSSLFPLTKEQKTLVRFTSDDVDRIYAAYPRKEKPRAAKKAIVNALRRTDGDNPSVALLALVEAFARSPAGKRGRYTPHPTTWFNGSEYLSDQKAWYL